jgi:hypothetical protein
VLRGERRYTAGRRQSAEDGDHSPITTHIDIKRSVALGYTASLCEISLPNACDADPCKNRGTCSLVTIDSFKCICPAGFKGERVPRLAARPRCLSSDQPSMSLVRLCERQTARSVAS